MRTPMTTPKRLRTAAAAAVLALSMLMTAAPAFAVTIVPACARNQSGDAADLNCVLATFENIANLILGVTGSFALLMFVYGGFTMLASGGSEEKVTKGKTILRNAVIGILIIMLAGYIVRYATSALRGSGSLQTAGKACGTATVDDRQVTKHEYTVDGQTYCASQCNDISGYSCTTEVAGKNCLVGLCPGSQNVRCCPN